jgi:T5SS/PEP-CTERM-associated repeat protein
VTFALRNYNHTVTGTAIIGEDAGDNGSLRLVSSLMGAVGTATYNSVILGDVPGATGTLSVQPRTELSVEELIVGNEGTGTLIINDGMMSVDSPTDTFVEIGYGPTGVGTIQVIDGGHLSVADGMNVGVTGAGIFEVVGGSSAEILSPQSLFEVGANGQISVRDSSTMHTDGLRVSTGGLLEIISGAEVEVDAFFQPFGGNVVLHEGRLTTHDNTLFYDESLIKLDANSTWESDMQITVGRESAAFLEILGSSQLVTYKSTSPTGTSGIIGWLNNSETASVTVSGSESRWLQDGALQVGFVEGSGELRIQNEGFVRSESGNVGGHLDSIGLAIIDNAEWSMVNSLSVGTLGTGEIELANVGRLDTGGGVTVGEQGTIRGVGFIFAPTGVSNSGLLVPGASSLAPLGIEGNFAQQSTGELLIQIGGSNFEQYGLLDVTGQASLAGTLTVELVDEFAPSEGDIFDILFAYDGISGSFETVQLPGLSGALQWQINYITDVFEAGLVQLEVISQSTLAGDFDFDGDVDGRDFLLWQRNPEVGNLADWQNNYGTSGLNAAVTAVPEPASLVLLMGLASGFRREKRFLIYD